MSDSNGDMSSDDSTNDDLTSVPEVEPVPVRLSERAEKRIEEIIARYPRKKSAVMQALYLAQEELGWVSPAAVRWVASRLELSEAHVYQVATFYTMYYKKPVGKYHFQLCRTLSCLLCGARGLADRLRDDLGIEPGEVSGDGLWSWEEVECLGSCGTAPMIQINDVYFENLTPATLGSLIERIKREQPNLRYSTARRSLGLGLGDHPRSQVW